MNVICVRGLGTVYLEMNKMSELVDMLESVILLNVDVTRQWHYLKVLAHCYMLSEDYQKAVLLYSNAISVKPDRETL